MQSVVKASSDEILKVMDNKELFRIQPGDNIHQPNKHESTPSSFQEDDDHIRGGPQEEKVRVSAQN